MNRALDVRLDETSITPGSLTPRTPSIAELGANFGLLFDGGQAPATLPVWTGSGGKSGAIVPQDVARELARLSKRFPDPWNIPAGGKSTGLEAVLDLLAGDRVITKRQSSALLDYLRAWRVDEQKVVGYNSLSMLDPLTRLGHSQLAPGVRKAREILMRWERDEIVSGASRQWSDY